MVRNRVGPPVTGDDFFGRIEEQRWCWERLATDHLLLLAPRRVGKTSLMLRLRERAAEQGFEACYMSCADAADEAAFVQKLYNTVVELPGMTGVWERLRDGPLGNLVARIHKVGAAGCSLEFDRVELERWPLLGERLARALDDHGANCLLLVDEVPVFVLSLLRLDPAAERARRFLTWFRALRQRSVGERSLRWLLAGSIGLDTVAARLKLGDTINDLHIFRLGPFSAVAAGDLLDELGARYERPLADKVKSHLLQRIGWTIPFYIQLVFAELRKIGGSDREVTISDVDRAVDDLLKPAYFDYWRQRLEAELGNPDAGYGLTLLDAIAADETGATRSTLSRCLGKRLGTVEMRREKLRYLLDVLESDGYILRSEGGNRYRFCSPLLREYWLRRVL